MLNLLILLLKVGPKILVILAIFFVLGLRWKK